MSLWNPPRPIANRLTPVLNSERNAFALCEGIACLHGLQIHLLYRRRLQSLRLSHDLLVLRGMTLLLIFGVSWNFSRKSIEISRFASTSLNRLAHSCRERTGLRTSHLEYDSADMMVHRYTSGKPLHGKHLPSIVLFISHDDLEFTNFQLPNSQHRPQPWRQHRKLWIPSQKA